MIQKNTKDENLGISTEISDNIDAFITYVSQFLCAF